MSVPSKQSLRPVREVESVAGNSEPEQRLNVLRAQPRDIFTFFLILRFINALCVRTFFQPDEYFQALEPAWSIAFGADSGAWLTWEWEYQLRSSLHPALFGGAYNVAYKLMTLLDVVPSVKSSVLVALPKVIQSVFAAASDFYTWKLAEKVFGANSNPAWAAFWMSTFNPWLWYCSTRTFSNSVETTLTIAALYYWPWEILGDEKENKQGTLQRQSTVNGLRLSLGLAAVAVLLRPTNIFIWLAIVTLALTRLTLDGISPLRQSTLLVLVRETVVCGSAVLVASVVSDRLYFGFWTFPPYKWLYFNVSQSLAVFYGQMPWHYYLVQGIPLLTTTFLPFVLVGLYNAATSSPSSSILQSNTLKTLSFAVLTTVGTLSLVSHKEVRFIYPLLPVLHVLAAPSIASFFTTSSTTTTSHPSKATAPSQLTTTLRHKFSLANILTLNLLLATYLSTFHQPATISVTSFLRHEFERLHPIILSLEPAPSSSPPSPEELFALFLTPCHSTPWRSHLVYPSLRARALTCEPPLHTAPGSAERETYRDEADRFYDDGLKFLGEEVAWGKGEAPRFIVGFEGVEGVLREFLEGRKDLGGEGVKLRKVWEGWNGLFNEDWRRRGKLVVWDTGVYDG
ncbi:glycosyltransferase family 22 protein [Coniochaeta sp. 2T2.1]|nr:glycosyltransferase family 22 protein [Coniochaeta sp. 2T2.1]